MSKFSTHTLVAYWGPREETARECANRLAHMIDDLAALHPAFARWMNKAYTLEEAYSPFCKMPPVLDELTVKFEQNRHTYDDPRDPIRELGFSLAAWNGLNRPQGVSLSVQAAAFVVTRPYPNHASMQFAPRGSGNEDLIAAANMESAMRIMVAAWQPVWMGLSSAAYGRHLTDYKGPTKHPWAGWMTYLSESLAKKVTPPPSAIVERTPDGGMLLIATREPFDDEDPAHLAAADAIQAALKPVQR
ncbi:MAG TPA: Imm52 family immunity protein [Candidatus Cybelea sp.]|nr:Imm52 family immunity protein [Candidatus Cybelea sp.]